MYNVGQADNLLSAGRVQYPNYTIGSLEKKDYPCIYRPPNNAEKPKSIPLGTYNNFGSADYMEPYVHATQQKRAGEMSDMTLLIIMIILFVVLCICTYMSFH
uniref:Uncharacterized protein n=1 Tax=viral metagenome TaxID=1070528 RepID=A0A6C0KQE7_9ZZZZ